MINRLILFGKDILALKFDVIMSLKKKKGTEISSLNCI